jgi:hypothetical protein
MRPSLAARIFIFLLTFWALIVIGPDMGRPFHPLGMLGIDYDNDGRILDVDDGRILVVDKEGSEAHERIVAGDRIDLGKPSFRANDDLLALFGGMGGLQYLQIDRRVKLELIGPTGARRSVTLQARRHDLSLLESVVLELDEICGIGFILLGAFLVWVRPARVTWGFFLFAVWFNPGQYFTYYSWLPPSGVLLQEFLQAIFQAAGIAGFVEFSLRFPNDRVEGWRRPVERMLPLLFAVLAISGVLMFATPFGIHTEGISRFAYGLAYALYPFVVFAFVTKLRVLPPTESLRLRTVIAGCIPGLLFFIIADSIESTSLWQGLWDRLGWQPPELWLNLCYLVNALVAVSVGYAVICRRVLSISFILNRGLVLSFVGIFVAMLVELILVVTHQVLEEHRVLSNVVAAVAIVLSAPFLERLAERLNHAIDQIVFRSLHHAEDRLHEVAEALAEASSLDGVERQLLDAPVEVLQLASAAFFTANDDDRFELCKHARNWPANAVKTLEADDPLVLHLRRYHSPTRMHEIIRDDADLPTGAAYPAIVIPLAIERNVEAFVVYGGHTNGSDLLPDEITILVALASAATAARDHVAAKVARRQVEEYRRTLASLNVPNPRPATGNA